MTPQENATESGRRGASENATTEIHAVESRAQAERLHEGLVITQIGNLRRHVVFGTIKLLVHAMVPSPG